MKLPAGFKFGGLHCGIKQASDTEDISLIVAEEPCVAAAVYTKNQVVAAPVVLDRQRTPSANIRAIITNSGNRPFLPPGGDDNIVTLNRGRQVSLQFGLKF